VAIEDSFVKLEKYMGDSDHNMDLPNMLHLDGLPQTAGWIDWLQLLRLLHDMVCTIVVVV
jgi:hypothetical protein